MNQTRCRLAVERLEDRDVPALFGVPWPNPGDLTLSFVPDGTPLAGGGSSSLFALMDETLPRDVWQREILRAFRSWTEVANINIRIVGDSGDPLGTPGAVQGDSRFGDVRVAATNLSADAIGTGAPFSWTGTTFAGDLLFNTNYRFNVGGSDGAFDLYTVSVQEAGHILGLGNSDDPTSVMHSQYVSVQSALSAADIAAVQVLYGARTTDFFRFSGKGQARDIVPVVDHGKNDRLADATLLKGRDKVDARFDVVYNAAISSPNDVDFYKVRVPQQHRSEASMIVLVWALEQHGLDPRVRLYDESGKPLAYRVLANDAGPHERFKRLIWSPANSSMFRSPPETIHRGRSAGINSIWTSARTRPSSSTTWPLPG